MSRLTEMWFSFKGVPCEEMGVRLAHAPTREIPVLRGRKETILGKSGSTWISEGDQVYEEVGVVAECYTLDGASIDRISAWLTGEGELIFSDEPDRAYHARIEDQINRSSLMTMFSLQRFPLTFTCEPFRYLFPETIDVIDENGGTIENPGTADSLPRITIAGEGDMSVTIAGQRIDVLAGSVIIDSELMICYESDGTYVNPVDYRVIMDDFPRIPPGISTVTWTGNVSSVTVEGRWRYL